MWHQETNSSVPGDVSIAMKDVTEFSVVIDTFVYVFLLGL